MTAISQEVLRRCQSVLRLSLEQGAFLHELRSLKRANDPRLREIVTELQGLQCGLQAECNSLKVILSAGVMTGSVATATVRANDLELHPANLPLPHPELPREQAVWTGAGIKPQGSLTADELLRMQATLHRAGDHTLDEEVKS